MAVHRTPTTMKPPLAHLTIRSFRSAFDIIKTLLESAPFSAWPLFSTFGQLTPSRVDEPADSLETPGMSQI